MDSLPRINQGERASVAGRSGSGKSTLARWLLTRSPGHWVILNPKHTKAFDLLPDSVTMNGFDLRKFEDNIAKHKFTIINPNPRKGQTSPEYMDAFVDWLHNSYTGIGLCADELYTLHKNGQAGEGLTGWLTRGRELKQSFLGLSQRPAWVSKFIFSESNYIGEMSLAIHDDRKKMYDFIGNPEALVKLPPREWLWYEQDKDALRKFGPVPAK